MKNLRTRTLALPVALLLTFCLGLVLTGCGSSSQEKDKAMEIANKYEALADKYIDLIKEKKAAGELNSIPELMKDFEKESMQLVEEIKGIKSHLSAEDAKEVEKRFQEVGAKIGELIKAMIGRE